MRSLRERVVGLPTEVRYAFTTTEVRVNRDRISAAGTPAALDRAETDRIREPPATQPAGKSSRSH